MNNLLFSRVRLTRFFSTLIFIYVSIYIQSYVFAQFSTDWLHIDLVTILLIFICMERNIFSSLFFSLIAGILMHVFSSAPPGVFIIYYLFCSILSNIISTVFLLNSMFFKFFVFCFLYLFKYFVLYLSLGNKNSIDFLLFLLFSWKSICITMGLGLILFQIFHHFENKLSRITFHKKTRLGKYA